MSLRPLVVCGPSGVGKGTLLKRLLTEHKDKFALSVSRTAYSCFVGKWGFSSSATTHRRHDAQAT